MKRTPLSLLMGLSALSVSGLGSAADDAASTSEDAQRVEITGSSIKRVDAEKALPVTIITAEEITAAGISNAEQLMLSLNIAGNGNDNLASNEGIVGGNARGNNGFSGANLRGQGSEATLVLLNGRRVAVHGMKGQAVDLNTIPMTAIERVEVLRDGASAVYGTDAIGGVINFITKKDYTGLQAGAYTDTTEQGGGDINRITLLAGAGDLAQDGWNAFVSVGYQDTERLRGVDRDFTNTFQPDRGLVPDTRGPEYATVMARAGSMVRGNLIDPANPSLGTVGSINPLNLPGAAGCDSYPNQGPYGWEVWDFASARYACAWDYPRAQSLQQPVETFNVVSRLSVDLGGGHEAFVEVVGSHTEMEKQFEPAQITQTSLGAAAWYPVTGAVYDDIYNSLFDFFGAQANLVYGNPIAYRWRCMACGPREIATETDAARYMLGFEGMIGSWDYRTGISSAYTESTSFLSSGYFYSPGLAAALGSGEINMWLPPGAPQSQAGMDLLAAASANGTTLYGGRSTLEQADFQMAGDLGWDLSGGTVQMAAGVDFRREGYEFNGEADAIAARDPIYLAPFDEANQLDTVERDVYAVYAEFLLPLTENFDVTAAVRRDEYDGFGASTNPKISLTYKPAEKVLLRAAYNTGFRVPTFSQLYFGVSSEPYTGLDLADPATCPDGVADDSVPGCEEIQPNIISGGKEDLQPEESEQYSFGVVWQMTDNLDASLDWWQIEKTGSIQSPDLDTMVEYYDEFSENFIRDSSSEVVAIDTRWVNAGGSFTSGIELTINAKGEVGPGIMTATLNGSYLDEFKLKPLDSLPYSENLVGQHTRDANLPLRWKHSIMLNYAIGDWSHTLTQLYRDGYKDEEPVSVENGTYIPPLWNPEVDSYITWHYTVSYSGFKDLRLTAGVKNLLDQDPPFTAHQNDFSAGAAWEPRVADPRGRSYMFALEYTFL